MPIVGFSKREPTEYGYMPCLGRFYKGSPKKRVKSNKTGEIKEVVGDDLDYMRFEFSPEYRGAYSRVAVLPGGEMVEASAVTGSDGARVLTLPELFTAMYGKEPKRIAPVRLASGIPEESFDVWNKAYASGGILKYRCDGETVHQHFDFNEKRANFEPIPCLRKQGQECGCSVRGLLRFVIPQFSVAAGIIGYFMFAPTSTYENSAFYETIQAAARRYGPRLRQAEWELVRITTDKAVTFDGKDGKRVRQVKPLSLVYLRPLASDLDTALDAIEPPNGGGLALGDGNTLPALPSGPVVLEQPPQPEQVTSKPSGPAKRTGKKAAATVDVDALTEAMADVFLFDLDTARRVVTARLDEIRGAKGEKRQRETMARAIYDDTLARIVASLDDLDNRTKPLSPASVMALVGHLAEESGNTESITDKEINKLADRLGELYGESNSPLDRADAGLLISRLAAREPFSNTAQLVVGVLGWLSGPGDAVKAELDAILTAFAGEV